jgi:hypothetical protein
VRAREQADGFRRLATAPWMTGGGTTILLALVLAAATWPITRIDPVPGLDPSWHAGLHLAARNGIAFGGELVFTYGPLGFLTVPEMYYGSTGLPALAYVGLVHVVGAISFVHLGRRLRPRWLAVVSIVLAASVLPMVSIGRLPAILAFFWAFEVLRPGADERHQRWFPPLAGLFSSFLLLVKFNDGVAVLGIAVVVVVILSLRGGGPRPLGLFAAVLGFGFTGLWLALGQRATDLPAFVQGSVEIASGYSTAMGLENAGREWEYAAAALIAVAVMVIAVKSTEAWPTVTRAAIVFLLAALLFLAFKHGFVRHDGHAIRFFALILIVLLPFGQVPAWQRAGTTVAAAIVLVWSAGLGPLGMFDPLTRSERLLSQVSVAVSADSRAELVRDARRRLRDHYAVDPRALELVTGRTVHVDPHETSVAWAYDHLFEWSPLPVFQRYSAYTAHLDSRNADRLSSEQGPERLLRHPDEPIDGRRRVFESPAATLATICHYREVYASPAWQVLARGPTRCGAVRQLGTVRVELDAFVTVPQGMPGEVVYAQVEGVRAGLLEDIRAAVFKWDPVFIEIKDRGQWRLVPETAVNGLLMAVPDHLGYSGPYALPSVTEAFRIWHGGPNRSREQGTLQITFFAVELSE